MSGTDRDTGATAGGREHRTASGGPSLPFSLVLLLLAAAVAHIGFTGLDQSLRAARGEGIPGTFEAVETTCVRHPGHESCTCHGTFTAEGGEEPRGVYLHAAGRDTCVEEAEIPAVDAGADNRVYGPDGSREWIVSALLLLAPAAVAGTVAATWVRHLRRAGSSR